MKKVALFVLVLLVFAVVFQHTNVFAQDEVVTRNVEIRNVPSQDYVQVWVSWGDGQVLRLPEDVYQYEAYFVSEDGTLAIIRDWTINVYDISKPGSIQEISFSFGDLPDHTEQKLRLDEQNELVQRWLITTDPDSMEITINLYSYQVNQNGLTLVDAILPCGLIDPCKGG